MITELLFWNIIFKVACLFACLLDRFSFFMRYCEGLEMQGELAFLDSSSKVLRKEKLMIRKNAFVSLNENVIILNLRRNFKGFKMPRFTTCAVLLGGLG